ncbi:MAG: hypothetical protein IBJ11_02830 [Phycisphaerales bacterium]|nr:hypothetical protein [Phycisphaerales bacterium]
MSDGFLLLSHAGVSCFLAGLIWTIQVVHYPLMARVGAEGFARYEREHMSRISLVVGPTMLAEMSLTCWIAVRTPGGVPAWAAWSGAALLAAIWLSTILVQTPLHQRLARGFDARAIRALVLGNWPRTLLWTARALLALWMLAAAFPGAGVGR